MRGKDDLAQGERHPGGITPAYAGKSSGQALGLLAGEDHPRVCGEKDLRPPHRPRCQGSPPRMRGKVAMSRPALSSGRITPAYAGKSGQLADLLLELLDHPRVCGEKTKKIP